MMHRVPLTQGSHLPSEIQLSPAGYKRVHLKKICSDEILTTDEPIELDDHVFTLLPDGRVDIKDTNYPRRLMLSPRLSPKVERPVRKLLMPKSSHPREIFVSPRRESPVETKYHVSPKSVQTSPRSPPTFENKTLDHLSSRSPITTVIRKPISPRSPISSKLERPLSPISSVETEYHVSPKSVYATPRSPRMSPLSPKSPVTTVIRKPLSPKLERPLSPKSPRSPSVIINTSPRKQIDSIIVKNGNMHNDEIKIIEVTPENYVYKYVKMMIKHPWIRKIMVGAFNLLTFDTYVLNSPLEPTDVTELEETLAYFKEVGSQDPNYGDENWIVSLITSDTKDIGFYVGKGGNGRLGKC